MPKELFRFYRAASHPEEKKGGAAAVSRTVEAPAAVSIRPEELSSLSLDDPGRTPRAPEQPDITHGETTGKWKRRGVVWPLRTHLWS